MEHSDNESPEEYNISGAGIVPISTAPNGVVYALLGREKYVKNWSSSLKWSGFEGGNIGTESASVNAAREMIEESLGMIFSDKNSLINMLETKNYIAQIAVKTMGGTRTHVTYVKYVPWDPDLPVRFGNAINYLVELSKVGNRLKTLTKSTNRNNMRDEEIDDGWTRVKSNDSNAFDRIHTQATEMINNPPVEIQFPHPAVEIKYNKDGSLLCVHVKDEHIEKGQIKYWPLSELEVAAKNGGNGMPGVSIRPYFCIIAKLICKYVTKDGECNKNNVRIPKRVCVRMKPERDLTYPPGLDNAKNIPSVKKQLP